MNEPTVKLYQDPNPLKRMWMISLFPADTVVFECPSPDGSSPPYKQTMGDIGIPMPIAADVVVRAGGRDTVSGSLVLRKGAKTRELVAVPWPDAATNAVVILRPNPELAERTTDLFEILGDEISPPRGK